MYFMLTQVMKPVYGNLIQERFHVFTLCRRSHFGGQFLCFRYMFGSVRTVCTCHRCIQILHIDPVQQKGHHHSQQEKECEAGHFSCNIKHYLFDYLLHQCADVA
jgi:hypothetical protein